MKEYYVSYSVFRNSGDFSSSPAIREVCTCQPGDTHFCAHFSSKKEAIKFYKKISDAYDDETRLRRAGMLNR